MSLVNVRRAWKRDTPPNMTAGNVVKIVRLVAGDEVFEYLVVTIEHDKGQLCEADKTMVVCGWSKTGHESGDILVLISRRYEA